MITQEDREAAAMRLHSPFDDSPIQATQERIKAGKMDKHPWVQAFAAHRITAEKRGREQAAVIADEYRIQWDKRGDFKQSDACRGLAAAIRNAKEA